MKKIVSIIISGLAMMSCVDTVLLPDNKTVEEDFWQTKNDVAMMVNGAYAKMATSNVQQRMLVWTMRADELNVNSSLSNNDLNQIYSANIQTTNNFNSWADFYSIINQCNLVLSKSAEVMDIDPNYLEGDHLNNVAQMKALRSLCYFYLVRAFRDVPLVLEPYKESSQEMNIPQVAPGFVIDQIIADLEEVKDYALSSQSIADWTRCGYFTRDGIYALLADVYLWKASVTGDKYCYNRCIECCDVIRANRDIKNDLMGGGAFGPVAETLDDDGFNLNSYYNYYNLFGTQPKNGNDEESLFELQFTDNTGLCIVYNMYKNSNGALPQFYASAAYAKTGTADVSVFNQTNSAKDVRGFESVYDFNGASDEGFMVRKFVAQTSLPTNAYGATSLSAQTKTARSYTGYDQNWIVYRVADVMLMKAEALVQKAALQEKAQAHLVADLEAATTPEDSMAIAEQMVEAITEIQNMHVQAARYAQIVNTRARIDGVSDIDSTKYRSTLIPNTVAVSAYATYMRAIYTGLAATNAELEVLVMDERARELCFEGKRWYDMLRYNYRHVEGVNYNATLAEQGGNFVKNYEEMLKLVSRKYTSGGGTGVTAKMQTEPYLYMPILRSEIEVNSALKQNPVYFDGDTTEKNY